ncbi:hypothetical protein N9R81_00315 [Flavobacteriales bacterium]|nr:hypothetical protein [Flavobacteriales bacterium]
MKLFTKISLALTISCFSLIGYGQSACHGFGNNACDPDLEGYVQNPQVLNAELASGESAEISMVFSAKHDYRVSICSEEHMGEVGYKIKSSKGDVLFDNQDHEMMDSWDFSMSKTKRLIIEVTFMGAASEDGFEETGCTAIIVGYRHSTQKGFR